MPPNDPHASKLASASARRDRSFSWRQGWIVCLATLLLAMASGIMLRMSRSGRYHVFPGDQIGRCLIQGANGPGQQGPCVTDIDKKLILAWHNRIRLEMARGGWASESAADMLEMQWDDELANIAQQSAESYAQSDLDGGDRERVSRFHVGQNTRIVNISRDLVGTASDWAQTIRIWVSRKRSRRADSYTSSSDLSAFTQMIRAETYLVGCGFSSSNREGVGKYAYVCKYGPISSPKGFVFSVGLPCSKCPTGFEVCKFGLLCSKRQQASVNTLDTHVIARRSVEKAACHCVPKKFSAESCKPGTIVNENTCENRKPPHVCCEIGDSFPKPDMKSATVRNRSCQASGNVCAGELEHSVKCDVGLYWQLLEASEGSDHLNIGTCSRKGDHCCPPIEKCCGDNATRVEQSLARLLCKPNSTHALLSDSCKLSSEETSNFTDVCCETATFARSQHVLSTYTQKFIYETVQRPNDTCESNGHVCASEIEFEAKCDEDIFWDLVEAVPTLFLGTCPKSGQYCCPKHGDTCCTYPLKRVPQHLACLVCEPNTTHLTKDGCAKRYEYTCCRPRGTTTCSKMCVSSKELCAYPIEEESCADNGTCCEVLKEDGNYTHQLPVPSSAQNDDQCKYDPYSGCGLRKSSQPLIWRGSSTTESWPWAAAIYRSSRSPNSGAVKTALDCGGALIERSWVLTAAHCLVGQPDEYTIYLGKTNRTIESHDKAIVQEFRVKGFFPYNIPNPNGGGRGNFKTDIALIQLSSSATLNEWVSLVCYPNSASTHSNLKTGNIGIVPGWGQNEHDLLYGTLVHAELPVVSREQCINDTQDAFMKAEIAKKVNDTSGIDELSVLLRTEAATADLKGDSLYCAGYGIDTKPEDFNTVCQGDSGSAMVFQSDDLRWYAEGIVSHFLEGGKCSERKPGMHAAFIRVDRFTTWIQETIRSAGRK